MTESARANKAPPETVEKSMAQYLYRPPRIVVKIHVNIQMTRKALEESGVDAETEGTRSDRNVDR